MLKKKVAATITPVTRMCKCGHVVSINATEEKIKCDKCGEIVHENSQIARTDSETKQTDSE